MDRKIRDLPRFPDYVDGMSDHDFVQAAWEQGPMAVDKYGFIVAFQVFFCFLETVISSRTSINALRIKITLK